MSNGMLPHFGGIFGKNRKSAYYRYMIKNDKKERRKRNGKIYSNAGRDYSENKKRR